jgi:peptidoglycan/LPS O-acetylase OafA/YrhL
MSTRAEDAFAGRCGRLVGVDLLRGLAILFVLLNHVNMRLLIGHIPYGAELPASLLAILVWSAGVQMFFAISSFLITSTSLRRWGNLVSVRVLDFYRLRFARIAPLLLLLLALTALDLAHADNSTTPMACRPLTALGRRSYEIYLTHMFVVFTLFQLFQGTGKSAYAVPLLFALVILVAGVAGALTARLYSEPLNRLLRARWRKARRGGDSAPAIERAMGG